MVHSKEKVTCVVCFWPQKRPLITSLNGLKNEEIKSKKVRVSDSNNYLLCNFPEVSEVSINFNKKDLLNSEHPEFICSVATTNSKHLEVMLCI